MAFCISSSSTLGSQSKDWGWRTFLIAFPLADRGGSCEAVHERHLEIHKDQIEGLFLKFLHHFQAISGHGYRAGGLF